MKKKLLLLFVAAVSLSAKSSAQENQNPTNTYRIEVQGVNALNQLQAISLLTQLTAAHAITYDADMNLFTLKTAKELDANIISGKMQKNFFPVTKFQKAGEPAATFPQMKNTGNAEADAVAYEEEKSKWIAENPEAYKEMISNPSVPSAPKK